MSLNVNTDVDDIIINHDDLVVCLYIVHDKIKSMKIDKLKVLISNSDWNLNIMLNYDVQTVIPYKYLKISYQLFKRNEYHIFISVSRNLYWRENAVQICDMSVYGKSSKDVQNKIIRYVEYWIQQLNEPARQETLNHIAQFFTAASKSENYDDPEHPMLSIAKNTDLSNLLMKLYVD
jgi:hypothetical protein